MIQMYKVILILQTFLSNYLVQLQNSKLFGAKTLK